MLSVMVVAQALLRISRIIHKMNPKLYALNITFIYTFIGCSKKNVISYDSALVLLALLTYFQGEHNFFSVCSFMGEKEEKNKTSFDLK